MTAPYLARAAADIAQPLRHEVAVRANHPSWAAPIRLDVESGTLTFDESRSPFVTADLVARVPSAAEVDLLDPRTGVRLEVDAGYVYGDGVRDVHPLAVLHVWSRNVERPGNTLSISARSGESRMIDDTVLGPPLTFGAQADAGQAIAQLIALAAPGAPVVNTLPAATFVTGADVRTVGPGDDLMAAARDIADRAGNGWVYEDGLGTWYVRPRPELAGLSSATFKVGPGGTLERATSALELDEWYNAVVVVYRWDGGESVGWAEVTTGPMAPASAGRRRVLTVTRDAQGSPGDARNAAAAILDRTVSRGRSLSLQVASAPYWLRPGRTSTVQLPTGTPERHLVSSVQFDLAGSGTANIATRVPEDVAIITGE